MGNVQGGRPRYVWILLLILALATVPMVIGLAGCGDDEEELEEALEQVDDAIDDAINEAMDHSVEVTGFTCPIPTDSTTGEPEAGNVLASVSVTIKNDSDSEYVTGAGDFSLEDQSGTVFDSDIFYDGDDALGVALNIPPGEEVSGRLVFEVPADAKPMYLVEDTFIADPNKIELPEAS